MPTKLYHLSSSLTAPVASASGHLTSAIAISLLVHVTVALIGVEPVDVADVQIQQGQASRPVTLTLSVVAADAVQPPPITTAPPPVGVPDAPTVDDPRPAELPEQTPVERAELAALLHQFQQALARFSPTPPTAGRPVPSLSQSQSDQANADPPPQAYAVEPQQPTAAPRSPSTASSSEAAGAKVDVDARPLPDNPPPVYPATAVLQGRQGRVMLRVVVDSSGVAVEVTLLRTSGHADLDHAAVEAVRRWRFVPAQQGGRAVTQTIAVPIRFLQP